MSGVTTVCLSGEWQYTNKQAAGHGRYAVWCSGCFQCNHHIGVWGGVGLVKSFCEIDDFRQGSLSTFMLTSV